MKIQAVGYYSIGEEGWDGTWHTERFKDVSKTLFPKLASGFMNVYFIIIVYTHGHVIFTLICIIYFISNWSTCIQCRIHFTNFCKWPESPPYSPSPAWRCRSRAVRIIRVQQQEKHLCIFKWYCLRDRNITREHLEQTRLWGWLAQNWKLWIPKPIPESMGKTKHYLNRRKMP